LSPGFKEELDKKLFISLKAREQILGRCILKKNLFSINMFLGILSIIFSIIFLILIPYQTSGTFQHFGASPRDFPYVLGSIVLICGFILIFDSLKNKAQYRKLKIKLFSKNENLRLLKFIVALLLLPVLMERLGFFVGIIIILSSLLLISGVKKKITIITIVSLVVLITYGFFKFLQINLPSGMLF